MATRPTSDFAAHLRHCRQTAALTQEELAFRAGLSARGISDLERGVNRSAQAQTARMLADALGLEGSVRQAFLCTARGRPPSAAPEIADAPLPARPGNLPVPPTPLIDRLAESAALSGLLGHAAVRLVTLTGVGGTGKTRLALELAWTLHDEFPGGAWFVDLSSLHDPGQVAQTAAEALGIDEATDGDVAAALARGLGGQRSLLVLDNFEQLLPAAPLVSSLLARCPTVTVLVTSRVPLRVRGEHQFPVPSLEVPSLDLGTPAECPLTPACALFVERARAVRPDLSMTEANARAIAEICVRLDGLPLAIELAAACANVLSPQAILCRLGDGGLPVRGPSDVTARQRSLRGAIDWSYRLLDGRHQVLYCRMAVFAGGFTVDAAEAVADGSAESNVLSAETGTTQHSALSTRHSVLDGLATLVEHSLLLSEHAANGDIRFRMLETIRDDARDRLAERGEEATARRAHAAYYLDLAERAEPHLTGPGQAAWLVRLAAEHDNVRAALDWLHRRGERQRLLRLTVALSPFWDARGHLGEARAWRERALVLADQAAPATAPMPPPAPATTTGPGASSARRPSAARGRGEPGADRTFRPAHPPRPAGSALPPPHRSGRWRRPPRGC